MNRALATVTWKWSPPPVRSRTATSVASGKALRSNSSRRAVTAPTIATGRVTTRRAQGTLAAMDVGDETFEAEVVERSREMPVVVDFWAEWCGPCHMLAPVLERAVAERNGAVVLAKVDVDANPALAARFGIRGIPAVKAFRNGHVVSEFAGARPAAAVEAFLDELTEPGEGDRLVEELRSAGRLPEVVEALERGDHEAAFERLLERLPGADEDEREEVRRVMVALFGDLGQDHPLSTRYRRRLATALH